ncbi:hypothetical protein [Aureliella helgolandensis]|uniref:Hemerythrin-like domain-containing protein n=1 Tax=Aureliella helgolandensis TaxID=2527968 RepID=A0A518G845_9BACT|nr:hypothetical protein [Aureliella helgolandensis]QDV24752.1 hypothetical protein Q31a_30730 [Aureliella helgolandensis]
MSTLSSSKQTTIVNAAFLQEVKDSNYELWATLHELRELVETNETGDSCRKFVLSLEHLRDSLALEFSLEETYGYITGARVLRTDATGDAECTRRQHGALYLQLQEICEQAEEAEYRGTIARDLAELMEAYAAFDSSFLAHEALEARVIDASLGKSIEQFE